VKERRTRRALLSAFLFLAGQLLAAQSIEAAFGAKYAEVLDFVCRRAGPWRAECRRYQADARVLIPVVFPELLRYSIFRDEMETIGLTALYVSGGKQAADYSIGLFQMKPSFVEKLEERAAGDPTAPPWQLRILDRAGAQTEQDDRAVRLRRLRTEEWQLLYLACFARDVQSRFALQSLPEEEQVRFLAAAYNRGFWLSEGEIAAADVLPRFPARRAFRGIGPFRYSDVSVDFYLRHWREICGP
jgi:hypothetical protein